MKEAILILFLPTKTKRSIVMKNTPRNFWILGAAFFLVATLFGLYALTVAYGQCADGTGNIFNATVIIHESIRSETDTRYTGSTDTRCFGESVDAVPLGQNLAFAVHGDDPITAQKDGLYEGEPFFITGLTYINDAIYIVKATAADTTLSALLDSLTNEIVVLAAVMDSTYAADSLTIAAQANQIRSISDANSALTTLYASEVARADSLQSVIDNFPSSAEIADLQQRVIDADNRVVELEANLQTAGVRLVGLLTAIRSMKQRGRR